MWPPLDLLPFVVMQEVGLPVQEVLEQLSRLDSLLVFRVSVALAGAAGPAALALRKERHAWLLAPLCAALAVLTVAAVSTWIGTSACRLGCGNCLSLPGELSEAYASAIGSSAREAGIAAIPITALSSIGWLLTPRR